MAIQTDKSTPASAEAASQHSADFEALFEQHWPRVYGVLYRLLGEHHQAEDLALEVFWRLHRRLQRPLLPRPENLAGWLYRVATRLGLNALRSQRRRQDYERQAGLQALDGAGALNPEQQLDQAEQQAQVRAALAQIKPRSARLLVLRHSGLSYAELAAAVRVAPGSVGTLLRRAEQEFARRYQALQQE